MDDAVRQAILQAFKNLPQSCRYTPATEEKLRAFEDEFGPIPEIYRWFLAECGGGVCGSEWIDGIDELSETHRKFRRESGARGWTLRDVCVIGWDGFGNPFGIHESSGRLLVEDHNFGGVHPMAESFEAFIAAGLLNHDS